MENEKNTDMIEIFEGEFISKDSFRTLVDLLERLDKALTENPPDFSKLKTIDVRDLINE